QAKLQAPGGASDDRFGRSVAIYGDTIVVGALGYEVNGYRSGSAYVFVQNGGGWTNKVRLLVPRGATDDRFEESVSICNDTIVVGAAHDDENGEESGSAGVFVI
ncbi:hypothetical protein THAOC_05500, partial [Thalassiosira oceanica]